MCTCVVGRESGKRKKKRYPGEVQARSRLNPARGIRQQCSLQTWPESNQNQALWAIKINGQLERCSSSAHGITRLWAIPHPLNLPRASMTCPTHAIAQSLHVHAIYVCASTRSAGRRILAADRGCGASAVAARSPALSAVSPCARLWLMAPLNSPTNTCPRSCRRPQMSIAPLKPGERRNKRKMEKISTVDKTCGSGEVG